LDGELISFLKHHSVENCEAGAVDLFCRGQSGFMFGSGLDQRWYGFVLGLVDFGALFEEFHFFVLS
jgi:hypothetical protein